MEIGVIVTDKDVKEFEAYKNLYDHLQGYPTRAITPQEKLDYVKARVFDTTVWIRKANQ